MKTTRLLAAALALMFVSCARAPELHEENRAQDTLREKPCPGYDGTIADPCKLSMHALLAQPEMYDQMYVELAGFFVEGLDPVLFIDRDSAENSILKNALFVSAGQGVQADMDRYRNRYVTLVGKFSNVRRNRSEQGPRDYSQFSGFLQVEKVGSPTHSPVPYACWRPDRDRAKDPRTVRSLLGEKVCLGAHSPKD